MITDESENSFDKENDKENDRNKDKKKKLKIGQYTKKKSSSLWIVVIFFITFILSAFLYIFSSTSLANANIFAAFLLLLAFILIGIIFDIIGIAVTSGDEKTLNSMAAKKVYGARKAVSLIKNAEKVSNFCNDVVGDIAGVISGSAGAIILAHFITNFKGLNELICGMIITALTASLTVGGKAIGKTFAINSSNNIVFNVGKIITFFTTNPFKKNNH